MKTVTLYKIYEYFFHSKETRENFNKKYRSMNMRKDAFIWNTLIKNVINRKKYAYSMF